MTCLVSVCKGVARNVCCKGVTAAARCCMVSGLTCDYRAAGPSLSFHGAQAEATCDADSLPLGQRNSRFNAEERRVGRGKGKWEGREKKILVSFTITHLLPLCKFFGDFI